VWLNKKYPLAQAKRMRVAETIPLGEKRFVTLLTIDGREFLIGASTSGVSLLSQWDVAAETPVAVKPRFGMRGSSE
jgi:flagellar biogenesis protein FliO